MNPKILVNLARALVVLISCLLGLAFAAGIGGDADYAWRGAVGGSLFGLLCVGIDNLLGRVTIRGFSTATFGLLVGLLCAWLVTRIGIFDASFFQPMEWGPEIAKIAELCLYLFLGFLGTTIALRSDREEFSFILPYVRFRREAVHDNQPVLLDTNIIIDGRITGIVTSGFLPSHLVVPRFVIDELHRLADSRDPIKQNRGRRGLDSLAEIQKVASGIDVSIYEEELGPDETVDPKLIALARELDGRILSNDRNLAKVAELSDVPVLNLNELAVALSPPVIPGDEIEMHLAKSGREDHQGVGYLPDGTMVVVNHAAASIGQTTNVIITSSVQTSTGRLIFAELAPSKKRAKAS